MSRIREIYGAFLTSLHQELPLKTMDKKLIINVAPVGSFTSRQQNPYHPYTMTENVQATIESVGEGAAIWHVHARDDDGLASKDPAVMLETIDRVRDRCPDVITSVMPYCDIDENGVGQVKRCVDEMVEKGPHYMETAVLLAETQSFTEKFTFKVTQRILTEIVQYLEEQGVKPEFQGTSYHALKDTYDWIVAQQIAKAPPLINVMMGFHGFSHATPLGPDPWNYIYLMTMQSTLPAGAVTGICAGGRNWLPFASMAILLGFDSIRIGMEDAVYMYPHRDDKIMRCADVVRAVATIARSLGREIATPAEARAIMGLPQIGASAKAPVKAPAAG